MKLAALLRLVLFARRWIASRRRSTLNSKRLEWCGQALRLKWTTVP